MSEYELVVITKGDLDLSTEQKQVDEIKKTIESAKGEILNVDTWGKKTLAYEIQKQTFGYYTLITFRSDPHTPNELSSRLRLMEDLLRFVVIKKEGIKAEKKTVRKKERVTAKK